MFQINAAQGSRVTVLGLWYIRAQSRTKVAAQIKHQYSAPPTH
ncbi:hypothetical protein CBM2591_A10101 [Cupriavidus taiwanensis]|nr:hypothetical protein CBM2591_A10101 [Cupriavidus taiwanensis]SOZ79260.1 hypothetical protein CBM2621_A10052 [Cupriavidus taiwanensis]